MANARIPSPLTGFDYLGILTDHCEDKPDVLPKPPGLPREEPPFV